MEALIKDIELKIGKNGEHFSMPTNKINIIIGPNNSGKSLMLREIKKGFSANPNDLRDFKLVEKINLNYDKQQYDHDLNKYGTESSSPYGQDYRQIGVFNSGHGFKTTDVQVNVTSFKVMDFRSNSFFANFISSFDAKTRMNLINQVKIGNLLDKPNSVIKKLLLDNHLRKKVRSYLFSAFNKYFVIDSSEAGIAKIRYSGTEPQTDIVERSYTAEAIEFQSKASLISVESDGVQALTGMVMTLVAGDEKVITIDEPEAFLHPMLVYYFGRVLSEVVKERNVQLFIASHSPMFLKGCLDSSSNVSISRITYYENKGCEIKCLSADDLREMNESPKLKSMGIIHGLFYKNVLVAEADTDTAFYSILNDRIAEFDTTNSISNGLFINALNKQEVPFVIKLLRKAGVLAVGIVDLDVFKDGGEEFRRQLDSVGIPKLFWQSLELRRKEVKNIFVKKFGNENKWKKKAREGLKSDELDLVNKLILDLTEYGLFVVPDGELESWIDIDVPKRKWFVEALNLIGKNSDEDRMKPDDAGMWKFLHDLNKWLVNPTRKGI